MSHVRVCVRFCINQINMNQWNESDPSIRKKKTQNAGEMKTE